MEMEMDKFEKLYYQLLSDTKKILINNLDKKYKPTILLSKWSNITCKNETEG